MSNKMITVLGGLVVGLGLLATTTQGCGSSGGGTASPGDIASICSQGCTHEIACGLGTTMAACVQGCTEDAQSSCTNIDAIVAKGKECAAITDCTMLAICGTGIPKCVTGSGGSNGSGTAGTTGTAGSTGTAGTHGTAGTSGTAGSTGTAGITGAAGFTFDGGILGAAGFTFDGGILGAAGTAGSTCDTACAKADACCKALKGANATDCTLQTQCAGAGANAAQIVSGCNATLELAALAGANEPAACK